MTWIFHFFFSKIITFHCFSFLYCFQDFSPAAPSAALAAPVRPYLATVGTPVAAARVAAHWRSSPLVVVVVGAGSAPPLWRRELAGEPERRRRRNGSGRGSSRLPSCRAFFFGGRRGWHDEFKPRPLVRRLAFLAACGQVCHQFPGGDPAGVGCKMDSVSSPDARPIHGCQILGRGLAGTKEAKDI